MKEKAIQFGAAGNLTGILCEPRSAPDVQRPGVLLLNSGILHRVGACRLHVQIARSLAASGLFSLRFDFSGIGDSEPRKDSLPFEESAPLEIFEGMDYLQRTKKVQQFLLVGLCSGADAAFHAAVRDTRVVGICQLDPWPYRTWRYYVHYYGPRVRSGAAWKRFLGRKLGVVPQPAREIPGEDLVLPTYVRECPPRHVVAEQFAQLMNRGVRLLHIYSGGQEDYNYRRQVLDAFRNVRFGSRFELEYLPEATHIFSNLEHQERVVDRIGAWATAVASDTDSEGAENIDGGVLAQR